VAYHDTAARLRDTRVKYRVTAVRSGNFIVRERAIQAMDWTKNEKYFGFPGRMIGSGLKFKNSRPMIWAAGRW
jgi:hypothetical protein